MDAESPDGPRDKNPFGYWDDSRGWVSADADPAARRPRGGRSALADSLIAIGLYVLIVVGGTVAGLTAALLIGYLPYSDRPGPGWQGWLNTLDIGHIWAMIGFGLFAAPYAAVVGLLLVLMTRGVECVRFPVVSVKVAAATTAAVLSAYLIAGMGWYIALAGWPPLLALALGAYWGAAVAPRKRAKFTASTAATGPETQANMIQTVLRLSWQILLGLLPLLALVVLFARS